MCKSLLFMIDRDSKEYERLSAAIEANLESQLFSLYLDFCSMLARKNIKKR